MVETPHRTDLTDRVLMNKLRVIRLLGEGGMGAVYEVEHLITRHRRALKVMHSSFASSPETIARFVREAGVAGTLKTPHVVETYDAGQLDDGSPYVLMELLEGRTLGALFESGEKLSVGRLVGLICQVLEGLDVAHRSGIVHRDIKPDNVFVGVGQRDMPRVTLLDFGISKFLDNQFDVKGSLTAEGTMMGTPYYMSLEQATGRPDIDVRSDLYSVGVMLYEGLVGRRPYEATSLTSLVVMIHEGDHVPVSQAAPEIPPELAAVVEKAFAVKREDRFQTASELLAALVPYADSRYVVSLHTLRLSNTFDKTLDASAPAAITKPRASVAPTVSAVPTHPVWTKVAALGVLAIVAIAAYAAFQQQATEPPSEEVAGDVRVEPETPVQPVVHEEPAPVETVTTAQVVPEVHPSEAVEDDSHPRPHRPVSVRVEPDRAHGSEPPPAEPPSVTPPRPDPPPTTEPATTMDTTQTTMQSGGRLQLDREAF